MNIYKSFIIIKPFIKIIIQYKIYKNLGSYESMVPPMTNDSYNFFFMKYHNATYETHELITMILGSIIESQQLLINEKSQHMYSYIITNDCS